MRFVKGHGTENDFVVLPPGEVADLDAGLVRALCDRRAGVGADGVLRVVDRTVDIAAADGLEDAGPAGDVRWFMDYRNADGSVAEMCGNGIRVFARYLVTAGLARPGTLRISTRAGVKSVEVAPAGDVSVDMGPAERRPDAKVVVDGAAYDAVGWSMGNPHLVVTDADLDSLDLSVAPAVDPPAGYPHGVNVEFVTRVGPCHIRMRVHERGVGETRSCGTGACAAAVAVMAAAGERTSYDVDVPGGRLVVTWHDDGRVTLAGPAVLVATGEYPGDPRATAVSPSG
ncbi:MAG TPA: diaminopimelate epimerase [Mycobacteriales bacterium]|nr:diaminopimelate epimerase [Mycobacteriales bacterium]